MGLRGPVAGITPSAEISRRATTIVYRGYDASLDRFVLLKVLRPEYAVHEDIAGRFQSEARLLARVNHPNVVSVYSYGRDDGVTYMTTEFVDGQTLHDLLAHGSPPFELSAAILLRVARGLAAAHAEGVLHRDLKPENILVSARGQVKITDFGLAVSMEAAGTNPAVAGTLAYMAPEVVGGEAPAPASDLFAAGAVMYELLTGQRAFPGATDSEVLDAVFNVNPMHGVESFSDAPPGLLVICSRLLQKDPSKRLPSASALEAAIESWLEEGRRFTSEEDIAAYAAEPEDRGRVQRPPPTATVTPASEEPHRRQRLFPAIIWSAAAVVLLVVIVALLRSLTDPAPETADRAGIVDTSAAAEQDIEDVNPAADGGEGEISGEIADATRGPSAPPEPGMLTTPAEAASRGREAALSTDSASSVGYPDVDVDTMAAASGADSGLLAIAVSPWASVWVDGDSVTTASVDTLELAAGARRIRLINPEFPEVVREIEVRARDIVRLDLSLWSTVARLSLTVVPWARVEIDGTVVDTIPPQTHPIVLRPGPHTLRLVHPDLGEIQREIVLKEGEHREMAYNMREASPR